MAFWIRNIERTTDNKLGQEVWTFNQIDSQLVLDSYVKMARATTRHKFQIITGFSYARYNKRQNTMKIEDVPFPIDVVGEAKQLFFDSVEVVKDRK